MAKRWSQTEDDRLSELAEVGASAAECATHFQFRSDAACRARANAMGKELGDGWEYRSIQETMYLQREDCGGSVGIRWTTAVRNGETFDVATCERMVKSGELKPLRDRPNVFSKLGR